MKSKWVAVALFASVGLNLALAGYVLGSRGAPDFDPTRSYPRWVRTLPEPRREALRPVVVRHMRALRPALNTLHQQHRALRNAIEAEPFDPAVLHEVLSNMRANHERVQQASHASFAEFVGELTLAERQALLSDMGKSRRRGPPHGGPKHFRGSQHRPGADGPVDP